MRLVEFIISSSVEATPRLYIFYLLEAMILMILFFDIDILCLSSTRSNNFLNLFIVRYREISRLNSACGKVRAQASNMGVGSGGYEGREESENQKIFVNGPTSDSSSEM